MKFILVQTVKREYIKRVNNFTNESSEIEIICPLFRKKRDRLF